MINQDELTRLVSRVMTVEDTMLGGPQQRFVFRARGHLLVDSDSAYELIDAAGQPMGLLTTLREEEGRQVVELLAKPAPAAGRNGLHLLLFALTILSVVLTGAMNAIPADTFPCDATAGAATPLPLTMLLAILLKYLPEGLPFAFSLLSILTIHELGHYIVGRWNKTPVSLPFFIPLPLISPFGTLGAVITMQQPRNRNRLVEIAVAGPLAGFLVGVPLLLYGLSQSPLQPLQTVLGPCVAFTIEGNSILYLLAKWMVFGKLLPAPLHYDAAPLVFWLRSFFLGYPWPLPGVDVMVSPLAFGAWVGMLITGINLIPVGQLDGGHMMYAIAGKLVKKIFPFLMIALIILCWFSPAYILMAVIIFFFGRTNAEPLDSITPLSGKHRLLAWFGLAFFILLFVPIPLQAFGG